MLNTEHNHSLNRLKIVLVEQGKNGRRLAERLNKSEHTISRWCKNKTLPSVAQLHEIASILNLDIKYWEYSDVLELHEALQKANESINKLGLVPVSL